MLQNAGAESGLADLKSFVLFVWVPAALCCPCLDVAPQIMFGSLPEESFLFLMVLRLALMAGEHLSGRASCSQLVTSRSYW